jgi:5-methylthioribose kinase
LKNIDLKTSVESLQSLLGKKGWLQKGEIIKSTSKPGEGNMNVVLRVQTNQRSFILKQSRPYVQKYQQIEAPLDRINVEHMFYESIRSEKLSSHTPQILAYDPSEHLLMMQDLGMVEDMTHTYRSRDIEDEDVKTLISLLDDIHQSQAPKDYPENTILRQLNHQHIFVLPFQPDNGFDLNSIQEGLQRIAIQYKRDKALHKVIDNTGKLYLSEGTVLLHGDFYPGSWMKTNDQIYILDPEFSFLGFAEFDLGVMAAHLTIATLDADYVRTVDSTYPQQTDQELINRITGIEIMRRIIGLAQLPLNHSLEEKEYLLELAHRMILS